MQRRDGRVVVVGKLGGVRRARLVRCGGVRERPRGLGALPGFASLGGRTEGGRPRRPGPGLVRRITGSVRVPGSRGGHNERDGTISQVEGKLNGTHDVADGGRAPGMGLDEGGKQAQVRAQQLLLGAREDPGADLHERVHLLHRQLPDEAHEGLVRQRHRRRGSGPEQGNEVRGRRDLLLARRFERLPGQREDAGVVGGEVAPLGGQTLGEDAGPQVREARRHVADEVVAVQALEVSAGRGGVLAVHPHEKRRAGQGALDAEELPELVVQEGRVLFEEALRLIRGGVGRGNDPAREVF